MAALWAALLQEQPRLAASECGLSLSRSDRSVVVLCASSYDRFDQVSVGAFKNVDWTGSGNQPGVL